LTKASALTIQQAQTPYLRQISRAAEQSLAPRNGGMFKKLVLLF